MSPCPDCEGSRHVWSSEKRAWAPCRCLVEERRVKRWRTAGIPLRLDESRWKDLFDHYDVGNGKALLRSAKALRRGERPDPWLVIYGKPTRARTLATALLLRSACDGGLDVRQTEPARLIDVIFDKSKDRDESIFYADALALRVGREPSVNKWTKHVVERVLTERWDAKLFTVLVSAVNPSTIGTRYTSGVVEDALKTKFLRISLRPKGAA